MRTLMIPLGILLTMGFAYLVQAAELSKTDFQTWPRSHADDFGCFLEKSFGYKDKKFNCSLKHYENKADPCVNSQGYYEGPEFPKDKSKEVDPKIESIHLSWEHGELQSVEITLNMKMTDAAVHKAFHLPKEASIQDCSRKNTCLVLDGFEHLGGGDLDCGQ